MPIVTRKVSRIIAYLFVGFLAFVFIVGGLSTLFGDPVSPKDIHTVEIQGTLAANPEINSYGKRRNIRLLLNEYPLRSFNIDGDAFYATKYVVMNDNLTKGDGVFLGVSADDYKDNIQQQTRPERVLPVAVYECRTREHVFLSLADYCKEANSNTWPGIISLVVGIVLGVALYFDVRKKRRPVNSL